jgi:hypothetical protein
MITVYPTKASALRIQHPSHGALKAGQGTSWPNDGYTMRMLSDGLVTQDASEAYMGQPNPLPPRSTATPPPARPARKRKV